MRPLPLILLCASIGCGAAEIDHVGSEVPLGVPAQGKSDGGSFLLAMNEQLVAEDGTLEGEVALADDYTGDLFIIRPGDRGFVVTLDADEPGARFALLTRARGEHGWSWSEHIAVLVAPEALSRSYEAAARHTFGSFEALRAPLFASYYDVPEEGAVYADWLSPALNGSGETAQADSTWTEAPFDRASETYRPEGIAPEDLEIGAFVAPFTRFDDPEEAAREAHARTEPLRYRLTIELE